MFGRRTRAMLAFLLGLGHLVLRLVVLEDEVTDLRSLGSGVAVGLGYQAAHDRDVGGIRTSRSRSVAAQLVLLALTRVLVPALVANWDRTDHALGRSLGIVAYRLWYGVLGGLPE